jgi:hypothetical protein
MVRDMHPGDIRGQRSSPLEVNEGGQCAALPYFLPYDGLRIASDKVLGKLFLSNGWVSFEFHIVEFFIIHNKFV